MTHMVDAPVGYRMVINTEAYFAAMGTLEHLRLGQLLFQASIYGRVPEDKLQLWELWSTNRNKPTDLFTPPKKK